MLYERTDWITGGTNPLYIPILIIVFAVLLTGIICFPQGQEGEKKLGEQIFITAEVIQYSITNSTLENIHPERTLYTLMLRILSAESREKRLKEGDIIKAFSEDKLSPTLFGEVIKASMVLKDERYWIKNIAPQPPKDLALDAVLYGLVHAVDPQEYAEHHDLDLIDSMVRVIIELVSPSAVPHSNIEMEVEARSENMLRALVPINELISLAYDPAVKFVRPPLKPKPANGEPHTGGQ